MRRRGEPGCGWDLPEPDLPPPLHCCPSQLQIQSSSRQVLTTSQHILSFNPLHCRRFFNFFKGPGPLDLNKLFERLKNFLRGELESRGVHGKKKNTGSWYNSWGFWQASLRHYQYRRTSLPLPLDSTCKRLFARSYSNKQIRELSLVFPRNLEFMKIVLICWGTVSWMCCNGWPSFSIKI